LFITLIIPSADPSVTIFRSVVFYNSLSRDRTSIVRLHVNIPNVEVQDPSGNVIASQVDPFFVDNEVSTSTFKVCRCVCNVHKCSHHLVIFCMCFLYTGSLPLLDLGIEIWWNS